MLTLTLVGTVPGLQVRHVFVERGAENSAVLRQDGAVMIEDTSIPTPRMPWELIKVSRRLAPDGQRMTWIGYYSFLNRPYLTRDGSYLGVGVWLKESCLPGETVAPVLRKLLKALHPHIPGLEQPGFALSSVHLGDLTGEGSDILDLFSDQEEVLPWGRGLSSDRHGRQAFVDLSDVPDRELVFDVVNASQTNSWFSPYSAIFISTSPTLAQRARRGTVAYIDSTRILDALERQEEVVSAPPRASEAIPAAMSGVAVDEAPVRERIPDPAFVYDEPRGLLADRELATLRSRLRDEVARSVAEVRKSVFLSTFYHATVISVLLATAATTGVLSVYVALDKQIIEAPVGVEEQPQEFPPAKQAEMPGVSLRGLHDLAAKLPKDVQPDSEEAAAVVQQLDDLMAETRGVRQKLVGSEDASAVSK